PHRPALIPYTTLFRSYDPRGMVSMFNLLSNSARLNEGKGGGDYASTHPLSIQRMSDIENRVSDMPLANPTSSDSFWYIRAKLRVDRKSTRLNSSHVKI